MLIDANAYIGHWPFRQRRYNTPASRLERMQRFGIDLALLSNLNGIFYKNAHAANEELFDALKADKKYSERFIPFAVINPAYASWREHLNDSTDRMGMKGIRLYPKYHQYELTDPACVELVQRARDKGIPVALSLRMVDSRPSSWMDLERKTEWALRDVMPIVRAVPDARYLILNIANSTLLSDEDTALLKKADVLMDTSGRALTDLGAALQLYGTEKFCFGTHAPVLDEVTGMLRIECLREREANAAAKELLRSGNLRRFMSL